MSNIIVDPPKSYIDGVKQPIAKKIEEMLKSGRRYFGSSGASMTHQAFDSENSGHQIKKDVAEEYLKAEREITEFLKDWTKDKPNAVLIDSVRVPDGVETFDTEWGLLDGGDTDHVLIIGSEVILIDTKSWRKKSNYTLSDDGDALRTNKFFTGGSIKLKETIHEWLNYLDDEASLTGIVCITGGEDIVVFRNRNWFTQIYRLVEKDRFKELLDEKWEGIEDYDKEKISTTLISQFVVNCIKPFDQYSKVFDMDNLRAFK